MDFLMFWVVLAILVESTRTVVKKYCTPKRLEKDELRESLLKGQDLVDTWDTCNLGCCSHRYDGDDLYEIVEYNEGREFYPGMEEVKYLESKPFLQIIEEESSEDSKKGGLVTSSLQQRERAGASEGEKISGNHDEISPEHEAKLIESKQSLERTARDRDAEAISSNYEITLISSNHEKPKKSSKNVKGKDLAGDWNAERPVVEQIPPRLVIRTKIGRPGVNKAGHGKSLAKIHPEPPPNADLHAAVRVPDHKLKRSGGECSYSPPAV